MVLYFRKIIRLFSTMCNHSVCFTIDSQLKEGKYMTIQEILEWRDNMISYNEWYANQLSTRVRMLQKRSKKNIWKKNRRK